MKDTDIEYSEEIRDDENSDINNDENASLEEVADKEEKTKEVSKGRKIRNALIELCIYVAIVVICVAVVPRYVLQRTIVEGKSMMNTLSDQDNLWVEKISYRFGDPKRFDVIVFYPHGRDSDDYYIKRIIGLPGETVQIIGDDIYINGKVIEENYGKDPITESGIAAEPLKLGDDEFFVLGDNREISEDSRYEEVGPVKRENIEGRAILRIYPFSRFGTFE